MKQKIFYGWWVIGALVLCITISSGTGFYCFGVFMDPIMEDFGWTKAQVTWIITIYWIVSAFSSPMLGMLVDRYGAKKVMLGAAVLNGASLLVLGAVNNLWQFYVAYGFKAIAHAGIGLVAIGAVVSKWFEQKRGRATGIATTGIGFGGLFLAPFAGFLIPISGWRSVFVILGVLLWVLVIPAISWIVKDSPEELGLLPDGKEKPADESPGNDVLNNTQSVETIPGISLRQSLLTPTYWFIAMAFFLVAGNVFGTLAHQTSYIESIGISRQAASLALGFTAGMGVLGKIFFGVLTERMPIRYTTVLCFGVQAIGLVILMMTNSMPMVWLFVIVFGFSMGGMATLRPLIIIDFFGTAAIGAILGSTALIFSLGAGSGPLYAAYIYDYFQSYDQAFLIYLISYMCATILIWFTPVVKERSKLG